MQVKTYTNTEDLCIQPQCVGKFYCDANKCKEDCCQHWIIAIDQTTYEKYNNIADQKLRNFILQGITINESQAATDESFAAIKLQENGRCPFFGTDKRCIIQKKLGEDYLSHICNIYPRQIYEINGVLTQSLDIACSVAADLILFDPQAMCLELVPINKRVYRGYLQTIELAAMPEFPLLSILPNLQIFILSVLQNRKFSLGKRLAIVGLLLEQTEADPSYAKPAECLALMDKFKQYIASGDIEIVLNAAGGDRAKKLQLNLQCLKIFWREWEKNAVFNKYRFLFQHTLGLADSTDLAALLRHYDLARQNYYLPYMQQYPHILENYFFNEIFRHLFPFMFKTSLSMNFLIIALLFQMVEFLLIGVAAQYKDKFDRNNIREILQATTLTLFHTSCVDELVVLLQDEAYDIVHMIVLLSDNEEASSEL